MKVVNQGAEVGMEPVVNSRYSIVIATAKRARQIIAGSEPLVRYGNSDKPLSAAVEELYTGKIHIMPEEESDEDTKERRILTPAQRDYSVDSDEEYSDEEEDAEYLDDEDEPSEDE